MNVLVTGATGFIGSHITRQLVSEGHSVTAFDLIPTMPRIADIKDKVEFVQGDICDLEVLLAVFRKRSIDHVVHTAAYLPEMAIRENPTKAIKVNIGGTSNIFEASKTLGVIRVVYASSDSVNAHGLEEDAVVTPTTIYGHFKYITEVLGRHFYNHFGLETIGFRFSHNYGPGGRLMAGEVSRQYGSGAIYSVLEPALMGKKVVAPYSGDTVFNWIYVKDNARLISLALQSPYPKRLVFNTPGDKYTMGEVADIIKKIIPSSEIRFQTSEVMKMGIRTADHTLIVDNAPVKEAFGFEQKYSLEDGFREYHEDLMKNPHLYRPSN